MSDVCGDAMKVYANWSEDALKQGAIIPTATELARGLDHTWQFMANHLAHWSPADMQQTFPDEWDGKQVDVSHAWVVWHVMEHDLHHGGEISLTLGMHGIPRLESIKDSTKKAMLKCVLLPVQPSVFTLPNYRHASFLSQQTGSDSYCGINHDLFLACPPLGDF